MLEIIGKTNCYKMYNQLNIKLCTCTYIPGKDTFDPFRRENNLEIHENDLTDPDADADRIPYQKISENAKQREHETA